MPVASNPLLQASTVGVSARTAASPAEKPLQALSDKGAGFDQVMARQGRDDTGGPAKAKGPAEQAEGGKPSDSIADDGKTLPADDETAAADESTVRDSSLVAGQITDAQPGAQLIQAQAETLTPMLQQPAVAAAAVADEEAAALAAFDPEADPLDGLPTLRLALEQTAQAQGTTSAHAKNAEDDGQVQPAVNTLANLLQHTDDEAGEGEAGEKAFGGLLDDGLKDLKGATSDTRVDDFADRLAALTQAATPKTAQVAAPAVMQQPLAMNQNAWTEGLVNRVMYLSSQNLKSADIQLAPAELGRLDIRVNLAGDQAAQITFMSGHAGVRDTLESQVPRLRELFAQQGLAQPDVNVADQSRGQQQQQQAQQDGPRMSGVAGRRAGEVGEPGDSGELSTGVGAVERQVVVGSSAVDYYA